jgi:hypothetical protein
MRQNPLLGIKQPTEEEEEKSLLIRGMLKAFRSESLVFPSSV